MYDLHSKMSTFYNVHVRLGKARRDTLAGVRDMNLDRLKVGLDKLGEEHDVAYAYPKRHCDQGSYAMHTLNQHPKNEYDIDVAIIFNKDDLPSTTLRARERIADAFEKAGGNFKEPPKARTNAVTVWYADGYHVDFAVYREYEDEYGDSVIEHAGAEWIIADPAQMKNWFSQKVNSLSPMKDQGATVDSGQMRRIVRLIKAFTKSREAWDLPGGMIISKLVSDQYQSDYHRDDVALYWTMRSIRDRLLVSLDVDNPVFPDQKLTSKYKYLKQVERLRDKLGDAILKLDVLFGSNCTRTEAMNAWHWVFQHDFWLEDDDSEGKGGPTALSGSSRNVRESPPFA